MSRTAGFPTEIWLNIFSYLTPCPPATMSTAQSDDYPPSFEPWVRLCRVSRQFRGYAEPLLYSSLFFNCHRPTQNSNILATLSRRPDLCLHVRNIDYAVAVECPSDVASKEERREISDSLSSAEDFISGHYETNFTDFARTLFENALQKTEIHGGGYRLTMLASLLILAKNVERVAFVVNDCEGNNPGHSIISTLFQHCSLPMDNSHIIGSRATPRPLANLRSLQLQCIKPDDSHVPFMYYRCIRPLAFLPQLERLELKNIWWARRFVEGNDVEPRDIQPRNFPGTAVEDTFLQLPAYGSRPNLKTIHISGHISPNDGIEDILRQFPNLETLSLCNLHFSIGMHICSEDADSDFAKYGDALRKYGSRLRRVVIDPRYGGGEWLSSYGIGAREGGELGSLCSLNKLEEVRVPMAKLIHVEPHKRYTGEEQELKLEMVLPPNIRFFQTDIFTTERDSWVQRWALYKFMKNIENEEAVHRNLQAVLLDEPGWSWRGQNSAICPVGWSASRFELITGPRHGIEVYRLFIRDSMVEDKEACTAWAMDRMHNNV